METYYKDLKKCCEIRISSACLCCPLCLCIMERLKKLTANPNKKEQSLLIYNATVVEPALLSPPAAVRLGLAKAPQGL